MSQDPPRRIDDLCDDIYIFVMDVVAAMMAPGSASGECNALRDARSNDAGNLASRLRADSLAICSRVYPRMSLAYCGALHYQLITSAHE